MAVKVERVVFRGQWLGGSQIDIAETNAKIFRVMIQIPEYAYNSIKKMTKYSAEINFTVDKYNFRKGDKDVNAKPGEGHEKQDFSTRSAGAAGTAKSRSGSAQRKKAR